MKIFYEIIRYTEWLAMIFNRIFIDNHSINDREWTVQKIFYIKTDKYRSY